MQAWIRKFSLAFRGIALGMRGQNSFLVHIPVAIATLVLASLLGCMLWQWCVLLICIALVLSAELANSAIEQLSAGLCKEHNEQVGYALDIASGAVLVTSIFAALIGCLIFVERLANLVAR